MSVTSSAISVTSSEATSSILARPSARAVTRCLLGRRRCIGSLLTFGLCVVSGSYCYAAESQADRGEAAPVDVVIQLIDELGASQFSRRERASKELLRMGLSVYEELRLVEDHPDRETRLRVRELLADMVKIDRKLKVSDFITGNGDNGDLPGWTSFQEIAGDTPSSRELFAEMLRKNWELLAKAEESGSSAGALLVQRCEELQHALSLRREQVSRADVATLLFLAVNPSVGVYKNTQQQIYNFCYRIRVEPPAAENSVESDPMRRLLGAWVARPGDVANTAFYSLNIALRYSLRSGLVPALQILDDEYGADEAQAPPYIRQYAILTVARFKDVGNRDKIESLLDDQSICYTQSNPRTKKPAFQCQIRDVALAILLHMDGKNPAEFGFERMRTSTSMVYQPNTLGFASEEKRAKAFAAYRKLHTADPGSFEATKPQKEIPPEPVELESGDGVPGELDRETLLDATPIAVRK